jgi:hypothetical protein
MPSSLAEYFAAHGVESPSRADTVLALLRIGTPDALREAELIVGKPIHRCPPAIPPWPPKPIQRKLAEPRVVRKADPNPCLPATDAHRRFGKIKVGMTLHDLLERGLSRRDIRVWIKRGVLEVSRGS